MDTSRTSPKRVLALQHVPFEGLGQIEPWLIDRGHRVTVVRLDESDDLPDPAEVDLLVIMGGPMGVHDEAEHPWLQTEKRFVRSVIDAGAAVLGICLGAQLIAAVMGGRVGPNPVKEIGW
ncbi:MAG: amidotransferase, partial [Cyanobacteriota bacterium]|nr:amidotransferase [Cyanobacteriota bacterium]